MCNCLPRNSLASGALGACAQCSGGNPPRNAESGAPVLADLEKRFAAVIAAFDACIAAVEGNIPWYESFGGPILVGADKYIKHQETEQSRNDRKNLVAKWAASKTDAEREEILKLATRWYEATRFGLNGCQGITPSLGEAMVDQVKDYAHGIKETVKGAGGAVLEGLTKPLIYVGVGLGVVIVLGQVLRRS